MNSDLSRGSSAQSDTFMNRYVDLKTLGWMSIDLS